MLAPSKATPLGALPTAKVPSVDPLLAFSLVTLLLPKFATQMLAPSKAKPMGPLPTAKVPSVAPRASHGKGAAVRSLARLQLSHVVAAEIRHPDVGSIKGHANGEAPHGKSTGPRARAIARPQLGHATIRPI